MKTSESIKTIAMAIVKAQSEAKAASKDGTNTFFNGSKYATLDSIIEATRDCLSNNKLAVIQAPINEGADRFVLTRLQHECGEYYEILTPLIFAKQDMQSYGSAITYAKRYALSALLNISTDGDDDGNAAVGNSTNNQGSKTQAIKKETPQKTIQNNKTNDFNSYVIQLGKNKMTGTKLSEHAVDYLKSSIEQTIKWHKNNNKVPHKNTQEFIDMATSYLNSFSSEPQFNDSETIPF